MDFDLIIVGMGPVGATAANLAGQRGLKTLVVDKAAALYPNPRAIGLDHEVMRVFSEIGIAAEIAPFVMPYRASEYRNAESRLLKRIEAARKPYPLGWVPNYVFVQPEIERVLREKVVADPNVEVMLETEATAVDQSGDACVVSLRSQDGTVRTVVSRFVLACDGGASPLRTAAGVALEDLEFDEPWLVVDVMLKEGAGASLPETNVQYCEVARPCTFVVGVGQHRRWEFMINPDENPVDVAKPEFIATLIDRWLKPEEYTLWRASTYRFHALVAAEWRTGNMFFLGDAAHMTPPFLAQGLCQGIRDASNLIWKLALVIGGRADERLLESYQEERSAHVKKTTLVAKQFGQVICERDPVTAEERDRRLMQEMAAHPQGIVRQSLIPGLASGYLAGGQFQAQGELLPQSEVEDAAGCRGLMDAFSGNGFRLIASADVDVVAAHHEIESNPDLAGIPIRVVKLAKEVTEELRLADVLADINGVVSDWMTAKRCTVVLARPDHYVFGVGNGGTDAVGLLRSAGAALRQATEPA